MKIISRKTAINRGLKYYFTGIPCDKGHIEVRRTVGGNCRQCSINYHFVWYPKNRKSALKSIKRWSKKNKKAIRDASRRYRANSSEKSSATQKRYYRRHKSKVLKKNKKWRSKNQDLLRLYNVKRRRQIKKATPSWADLDAIKKIYKQAVALQKKKGVSYHVDHIVPLNSPVVCGLHVDYNLQIMLGKDNFAKRNKLKI